MRYLSLALICGFLLGATVMYRLDHADPVLGASSHAQFSAFAGTWVHHGAAFHINPNGTGLESHRTYVMCSQPDQTSCDYVTKKYIYDGGFIRFRLTRVKGNKAYGTVLESNASWLRSAPVTVAFTARGILTLYYANLSVSGCGKQARAGSCGA